MPSARVLVALCVAACFAVPGNAQTTRFVDFRAVGSADGLTWTNAHTNLHAALAASVAGDSIHIAQGTYTPDVGHPSRPVGDRLAYWTYKSDVRVRGGYRGLSGGGAPDDRNTSAFPTILSGEIGNPGVPTDNSLALVAANVTGQIFLDGLTFTRCYQDVSAGLPQGHYGSALWTFGSAGIVLNDCTFSDNRTVNNDQVGRGGAVFIFGTPGTITNCRFQGNRISGTQFQTVAAGLFIWESNLQISDCLFDGNVNDASAGASYAGGLYIEHGFPVLTRCTFRDNSSLSGGGAVFHRNAWAPPPSGLATRAGAPTFVDCLFEGNSSNQGGAVWVWSRREDDLARLSNCQFRGNSSAQNGAAVFCNPGGTTWMQVELLGCLFVGNTSGFATVASCFDGAAQTSIANCTFASNSAGRCVAASGESLVVSNSIFRGAGSGQPLLWASGGAMPASASRCNIEGPAPLNVVTSNITSGNPLFVSGAGAAGDYRLSAGSPCIDAGDSSLVPPALTTDLAGNARRADDPSSVDTGVGPPVVDLGAYERVPPSCPADFDQNGQVQPADIAAFVNAWFASLSGGTLAGDFDHNGAVEPADVAAFVSAWFAAVSAGC